MKEIYRGNFDDDGDVLKETFGEYQRVFRNGKYEVYKNGVFVRSY